jgi:hypothetical protein
MSATNSLKAATRTNRIKRSQQITSIRNRRAERELFFWTAREALKLVLFAALVVYVVVSVVQGRLPGAEMFLRYV